MRIFLNRSPAVSAADVLGGVFIARRNLLEAIRSRVLPGSGLTPEVAEILAELFVARDRLSSQELVDVDGFVSFRDLRTALGYSAGLLSRRIGWLCQHHWAETKRAAPDVAKGLHGNAQKVRITELGRGKIGPLWLAYDKLAERLLTGVSPSDLAAHYRVNEIISDKLCLPPLLLDGGESLEEGGREVPRPAKISARPPKAPAKTTAPSL